MSLEQNAPEKAYRVHAIGIPCPPLCGPYASGEKEILKHILPPIWTRVRSRDEFIDLINCKRGQKSGEVYDGGFALLEDILTTSGENAVRLDSVFAPLRGYVYVVKNGDIYKIGSTRNLYRRLTELKPGRLAAVTFTDKYRALERELHRDFAAKRIPQTEYFRLSDAELNQTKKRLDINTSADWLYEDPFGKKVADLYMSDWRSIA